jgi:glycosyltransferase involved in cell wall biosynthesis
MNVLIVSGIWPPDVGGPASHGPEVARYLLEQGHSVRAVVTADAKPADEPFPVHWIRRSYPLGVRHAAATFEIARLAHSADVVYSTGMFARTAAGATIARRPYVLKLTGDPAFERARARGIAHGTIETFDSMERDWRLKPLRTLRYLTVAGARHVIVPSAFLQEFARDWGVSPDRLTVIPNALPIIQPDGKSRDELRREFGMDGPTVAFAGRFGPQKALDALVAAVASVDGVVLFLAGDGVPPPAAPRVRTLGALSRGRTLDLFAAADASVLASTWENFPHTVVESLSVGTPVIATAVGGVPEVVDDGVNGLLVPANDKEAFAAALRRYFADDELRGRLRAAAAGSVERYRPQRVYHDLELILLGAAR